jgi:hypothetical protein
MVASAGRDGAPPGTMTTANSALAASCRQPHILTSQSLQRGQPGTHTPSTRPMGGRSAPAVETRRPVNSAVSPARCGPYPGIASNPLGGAAVAGRNRRAARVPNRPRRRASQWSRAPVASAMTPSPAAAPGSCHLAYYYLRPPCRSAHRHAPRCDPGSEGQQDSERAPQGAAGSADNRQPRQCLGLQLPVQQRGHVELRARRKLGKRRFRGVALFLGRCMRCS